MKKSLPLWLGLSTVTLLNSVAIATDFWQSQSAKTETSTSLAQSTDKDTKASSSIASANQVTILVDYQRMSSSASNQIAVWIENQSGQLVRTLSVTQFTAQGGFARRPESLSHWVTVAQPHQLSQQELDAVSGATPATGENTYVWDGLSDEGVTLEDGQYRIYIEGTLYWESNVLFQQNISLENGNFNLVGDLSRVYSSNDETNKEMITGVRVTV